MRLGRFWYQSLRWIAFSYDPTIRHVTKRGRSSYRAYAICPVLTCVKYKWWRVTNWWLCSVHCFCSQSPVSCCAAILTDWAPQWYHHCHHGWSKSSRQILHWMSLCQHDYQSGEVLPSYVVKLCFNHGGTVVTSHPFFFQHLKSWQANNIYIQTCCAASVRNDPLLWGFWRALKVPWIWGVLERTCNDF